MAKRKAQESLSWSSSKPGHWMYDVFLSFRGKDTRNTFTGHLYTALKQAGVNAFIDDNELRRGEDITAELVRAIQGSRIALIVFSKRYGDSGWCLEELVKIMECRRTLRQMVFPVFVDVDPSNVRRQIGSFAEAFQKHEQRLVLEKDKVLRWRAALAEAANLSGWDLNNTANGHEAKFISKIVTEITRHLNNTYLYEAVYPVGIDSRVKDMSKHLGDGVDDVRMVGIWGMGGIGKTTIAKAVYNKFCDSFEGASFLKNVGETMKQPNGHVRLQEQLLCDVLKTTKIKVGNVDRGINMIKERLRCRRVLVIIDDIDQLDQQYAIAGSSDWFGLGSRIVVTTRDEHLLKQLRVDSIYPAPEMNETEALELFSWHAFRSSHPDKDYSELSTSIVACYGGLPLALEVLGSFLFGRSIAEWKSALEKWKTMPPGQIQEKLRVSYDGLNDDTEKNIFLDISCFFIGMDKKHVSQILDGCGFFAEIGITVLLQRRLVTVCEKNKLMVHDLLRDMGRGIVRAKSPSDPGKRSRLWHPTDVTDVLTEHSGTEAVQGLTLSLLESDGTSFSTHTFANMKGLRLLQLKFVQLSGGYEHLSNSLRWLCWRGFPLKFLPNNLNLPNVVSIDLRYSKLVQVWTESQMLKKLKVLNLSHSHYLRQSPDFSKLPNLEKLILKGCKRLSKVHQTIGDLDGLALVNLQDCKMLRELPVTFSKLKGIETLILSGCSRFKKLAKDIGEMVSLRTLLADDTAIREIPSSLTKLKNLECLSLCGLKQPPSSLFPTSFWSFLLPRRYIKFPPSLFGLGALKELYLRDCNLSDGSIPKDIGCLSSLEQLELGGNFFGSLPSLGGLSKLQYLTLDNCNLTEAATEATNLLSLSSLLFLDLSCNDFHNLPSLSGLSGLSTLILDDCRSLHAMPELPTHLVSLFADGCTALERMPNFSGMSILHSLYLRGSTKLIEIPGLDKLPELVTVQMEGCTNISGSVRDGILLQRSSFASNNSNGIYLPGNNIPEWFTYVNDGGRVSFQVPQYVGCDLEALTLCIIYSCFAETNSWNFISISVINHTKRTSFGIKPSSPGNTISGGVLWQGPLSNRMFNLEGGDLVEVSVGIGSCFQVKKIGVNLVLDEYEIIGESECESFPYPYSCHDKDDEKDVTSKRGLADDVGGPSLLTKYAAVVNLILCISCICYVVCLYLFPSAG